MRSYIMDPLPGRIARPLLQGVKLPRATLDREARRQGERARPVRRQENLRACGPAPKPMQSELILEPYQMIIQMEAWNIRERDAWGKTTALRRAGQEPERWHWVYTGRAGRRRGEPIGSGAIESTCRQTQCRFKRPGPYWSQQGDEALLCLETFWRNGRWSLLFPHNRQLNPSKNCDAPGVVKKPEITVGSRDAEGYVECSRGLDSSMRRGNSVLQ